MASPTNRTTFREYCLRSLGEPVVEINIDDDQVEDRIDDAIQLWREFHFDAIERMYMKHQLTQTDIDNQYLELPDAVMGVTRMWPLSGTASSINMFDLRYQLRLHDLYDFTSVSYVHYNIVMTHLRALDMMFTGEQPIRFNRHQNRVYIDMDWTQVQEGEYLIIEGYRILDPDQYPDVWNDRYLKALAVAMIKRNWGENLKKYAGIALPGGVTLNGVEIYNEAIAEIDKVLEDMRLTGELPPIFMVG